MTKVTGLSEDRQEVVILTGEAHESNRGKVLPIIRTESGAFSHFGNSDKWPIDKIVDGFSRIIPVRSPTIQVQAAAKRLLESMGITSQQIDLVATQNAGKILPSSNTTEVPYQ